MLWQFRSNAPADCTDVTTTADQQTSTTGERRAKRRGATAMEYCVMASFVLAVVVLVVQHIGSLISPNFSKASKGWNNTTSSSSGSTGS